MYQVDCKNILDFQDFVKAINDGFVAHLGGCWNGNLDAFNDYLSWPDEVPYKLVILGSDNCKGIVDARTSKNSIWPTILEIFEDNREYLIIEYR